jgi:hypothetical protein
MCVFLGIFALDAFSGTTSLSKSLGDFALHLVPALLLLSVVVLAWRREWIGAAVFLTWGVAYGLSARRLDWILAISGPLCLIGVLFLASWRQRRGRQAPV